MLFFANPLSSRGKSRAAVVQGGGVPAEGTRDVQTRQQKAPLAINTLCSRVAARMPGPPQQGEVVMSRLVLVEQMGAILSAVEHHEGHRCGQ